MSKYFPAGGGTYTLNSSISSTASTITLASFTDPTTGVPITMATMNTDIAYGTIGPRTSSSEFISFTGITQNADGTATLTGVVRGLNKQYPFTTNSAYKLPHSGQSIFILSDAPQVFDEYAALTNDNTLSGDNTFSVHSPTIPTEISSETHRAASIEYVNNIAIGGSPDASTTVKGIGKVSVAPVSPTNPIFVGDNDARVSPVSLASLTAGEVAALAGTGTPSSGNKYVTADTDALKQLLSNLSTSGSLGTSDTLYPSQKAVKTYVDALPTYISEQVIAYMNGTVVNTAAQAYVTSTSDGTALFLVTQGTNTSSVRITRFAKDTGTGQYYISHTTTLATAAFQSIISAAVAGNYLYVVLRDNGSTVLERYDKADLANATLMTVSGTGIGGNPNSMFSDGTNLYIYNNTAATYGKYSISGTTATFVTTIVYTSSGDAGAICDGTNVWITDGTGSTAGTLTIKKYALAGGAATSTTTLITYIAAYANASIVSLVLYNSTKLGITFAYTIGTTVTGQVLKINTITLP